MNLAKLSSTDKLAAIGAIATVVGVAVAASTYPGHWRVTWLAAILGIAVLAVILLPEVSPSTKLPGRKGSLMVAMGAVAAILMAFVFLTTIAFTFQFFDVQSFLFLVAVVGALVMGWAGWQAFQAEGGTFQVGPGRGSSAAATSPAPPPAPPAPPSTPAGVAPISGDADVHEEHDG